MRVAPAYRRSILGAVAAGSLAALTWLAGCASIALVPEANPQRVQGQEPKSGETTETVPGGVMLADYDYVVAHRAVTMLGYSRNVGFNAIRVQEGATLLPARVDGQDAWCSQGATWFAIGEARGMCFFAGSEGRLSSGYIAGTLSTIRIDVDIPFRVLQVSGRAGYRRELVFQGLDRNTIRVAFREFSDNLSRPDSQQELAFTLNNNRPTNIMIKNAQIKIFSASNERVTFQVIGNFR